MNTKKNPTNLVFIVALLSIIGSATAQTPIGQNQPTLSGPIKLQLPPRLIEIKEIRANTIKMKNPTWSPNGDKIAFLWLDREEQYNIGLPNSCQLWIVGADGSAPIMISSISHLLGSFCWSPDSKQIAFSTNDPEDRDIYIFNIETKARAKITNHQEHYATSTYCHLAWSPDGTKLAFTVATPTGFGEANFQVWIVDAQGKFWFKLEEGFNPSWFPDSKKLAFAAGRPNQCLFFIIDVNGKNLKKIQDPEGAFLELQDIVLSPDSKYLLCNNYARLTVTKLNENPLTTITILGDNSGNCPSILELNGKIMTVVKDNNVQIIDINKLVLTNTSKNKKITPAGAVVSQFKVPNLPAEEKTEIALGSYLYRRLWSWSPNGKEIAFVGKNHEIWKMNANGTNQKQLTFERTKLVQLAQQEQEKKQALASSEIDAKLNK